MDDKVLASFQLKYEKTILWMTDISRNAMLNGNDFLKEVKSQARECTIKKSGCSAEKFDKLVMFLESMIFELKDQNIAKCYWDCLDIIRKANQ